MYIHVYKNIHVTASVFRSFSLLPPVLSPNCDSNDPNVPDVSCFRMFSNCFQTVLMCFYLLIFPMSGPVLQPIDDIVFQGHRLAKLGLHQIHPLELTGNVFSPWHSDSL